METTKGILGCYSLEDVLNPHIAEKLDATATVANGTYEAVKVMAKYIELTEKRQRRERWVKGR